MTPTMGERFPTKGGRVAAAACFAFLVLVLAFGECAASEPPAGASAQDEMTRQLEMEIPVGETRIVPLTGVIRAAVGDPSIVDIAVIGPDLILANAKAPGKTSLHLWTDSGVEFVTVTSYLDLTAAIEQATELIGIGTVRLTSVGSSVILEGSVDSQEQRDRAHKIASAFFEDVVDLVSVPGGEEPTVSAATEEGTSLASGGGTESSELPGATTGVARRARSIFEENLGGVPKIKVADALDSLLSEERVDSRFFGEKLVIEGQVEDQNAKERLDTLVSECWEDAVTIVDVSDPLQVLIRALIVEVDRSDLAQIGITGGTWDPSIGDVLPWTVVLQNVVADIWSPMAGRFPAARLRALERDGSIRILAAPSLLTVSGGEASFLAGGEIPIYLGVSDGRVVFEWREYGVLLHVKATVDRLGLISLDIEPEVTEIDPDRGLRVGDYVIPAFTARRVKTSVVVHDGQTIAIGGLLSTKVTKIVEKLPVLADLPIIGALFQSTSFQKGQTELIVLITPEIVRASESADPGSLIAPDMEDIPASLR